MVLVPTTADDARVVLHALLLFGEHRLHTAKESPRRRVLLDTPLARVETSAPSSCATSGTG